VKEKSVEQLREIVRGIKDPDDVAEIEKVISETKGKVLLERTQGFWEGKTPCWEMVHCPEVIRKDCPLQRHQAMACWELEGTYCKLSDGGASGEDTTVCEVCRVYRRWGNNKPIVIKVFGDGMNTTSRQAEPARRATA
jgi:hypothetical protein